jgi:3-dehydroquinate synthase
MKKVVIHLPGISCSYDILVGSGVTKNISTLVDVGQYSKILAFIDSGVADAIQPLFTSPFFSSSIRHVVEGGEGLKSLERVSELWDLCVTNELDRHSLIINIGGGALCDVGAFVASTYMRGVSLLQIPTTLLAQVDASIGGKTGFNFHGKKNFIGTFYQPVSVLVDTALLCSLPKRDLIAGMAEIIKHGIIGDKALLQRTKALSANWYVLDQEDQRILSDLIECSCIYKARIVSSDQHEQTGQRKLLNFGHTFGHAFESISMKSEDPLLHGEAVALGMVAEGALAVHSGLMSEEDFRFVRELLVQVSLPIKFHRPLTYSEVAPLLKADKKNRGGVPHWSLPLGLGSAQADYIANEEHIQLALAEVSV